MVALNRLAGLLLALTLLGAAPAREAEESQANLIRGAFADGRLWLLTDSGSLFSIAEDSPRRIDEALPEPPLDLCRRDGELLVLTGRRAQGREWVLRRRVAGQWQVAGRARRQRDGFTAMDCNAGRVTLLTTRRIIEMRPGGPSSTELAGEAPVALVNTALFGTRDHLYVGINSGEWGGGLRRIDRVSGAVVTIERNVEAGACGRPLDTGCDPVHAIVSEPWRPGCVAIAIGLVHFFSNGRLVEICGDRVEELYAKPIQSGFEREGQAPSATVAFFGLIRSGDSLRAVGIDGVYRIGAAGAADFAPFPHFRRVGGVDLSFDLPGIVLVVTQVNRRASVSGGAPMIVAR
jgi:hypothetical protein